MNLDGINVINGRAEDEIINYRESFDIVTARAVAKMDILSELCIPYVKVGGYFLAMKGKNFEEELNDAIDRMEAYEKADPAHMFDYVFEEMPWTIEEQKKMLLGGGA